MLARAARVARCVVRPPPCVLTTTHTLARCFASAVPPPPPQQTAEEESEEQVEEDGGAPFVSDDPDFQPRSARGTPQQQSLTDASGPFTREARAGGGAGGHNILPPRQRGGNQSARADDPALRTLITRMNSFNITSSVDKSVPTGSGTSKGGPAGDKGEGHTPSNKIRPRKGGRPIHQADIVEQRGKVTPMQLHRILSSTQQRPVGSSQWSDAEVAEVYELEPEAVAALRSHLSLPFVHPSDERGLWNGGSDIPAAVKIQRALGNAVPVRIFGDHLRIKTK